MDGINKLKRKLTKLYLYNPPNSYIIFTLKTVVKIVCEDRIKKVNA